MIFERWPVEIRKHFMKHHQASLQAIVNLPCETQTDRTRRMLQMERFRRRILAHIVKMHPDAFS